MLNKVILQGRLCFDHKTFKTQKDKSGLLNTLAVQESKEKTNFIPFTAYGKTAELIYKHLKKGDEVILEGYIYSSSKDNVSTINVMAQNINFISTKQIKDEMKETEFTQF